MFLFVLPVFEFQVNFIFELNALFLNKYVEFEVDCRIDKVKYFLVLLQFFFFFFFFSFYQSLPYPFQDISKQFLQCVDELCSYHSGTRNCQANNCVCRRWVCYTFLKTFVSFLYFLCRKSFSSTRMG